MSKAFTAKLKSTENVFSTAVSCLEEHNPLGIEDCIHDTALPHMQRILTFAREIFENKNKRQPKNI